MRRLLWTLCFLSLSSLIGKAQNTTEAYEIITVDNVQNLTEIRSWKDTIRAAAFSPAGSTLAIMKLTGELEFVSMETLETIRLIENLETNLEWVDSIYYSADGSKLLIYNNNGHALLDLETGEIIASHTRERGLSFGWTDDFRRFLEIEIGGDYVIVYDTLSNEELFRVDGVSDYELSPDGTLLVTMQSTKPHVQVWEIDSQSVVFEIEAPSKNFISTPLAGAGFSPDGMVWVNWIEYLETANGESWISTIQFWNMETASPVLELAVEAFYSGLIFENDYVLAWGLSFNFSQICSLWNIVENLELLCPTGGNGWLTFSPDAEFFVVSNGTSPNLYIYALENTRSPIHTLETESTSFVEFSPDMRFILSHDLELRLWAVPASQE